MYRSATVHNYVLVWYKPHLTYPLRASWHIRPSQSLSRLAAMVFTSSHDRHPASALSFSTVRLQVVFGLTLVLFPSGVQVIAMLQLLFWSCLSMCPIIFHLLCFTSLIVGFMSALSAALQYWHLWSCHSILYDSSQALVMKYIHCSVISLVHFPWFTPVQQDWHYQCFIQPRVRSCYRIVFEWHILFNLTNALLAFESLFFRSFIPSPSLQTVAPKYTVIFREL